MKSLIIKSALCFSIIHLFTFSRDAVGFLGWFHFTDSYFSDLKIIIIIYCLFCYGLTDRMVDFSSFSDSKFVGRFGIQKARQYRSRLASNLNTLFTHFLLTVECFKLFHALLYLFDFEEMSSHLLKSQSVQT